MRVYQFRQEGNKVNNYLRHLCVSTGQFTNDATWPAFATVQKRCTALYINPLAIRIEQMEMLTAGGDV